MAEENDALEELAKTEKSSEPSAKSPLLTILVILNTLIMGAVAYFQYTAHEKISKEPSIQDVVKAEMKKAMESEEGGESQTGEAKTSEGILFPLEGFTVNLAQGDGPRRFIRLNVVLKFSTDSNEDEFKKRKAEIRDTVIMTLNSKRPSDLLSAQGKDFLKEELKAAINAFLVDGNIVNVFIVNFQVN